MKSNIIRKTKIKKTSNLVLAVGCFVLSIPLLSILACDIPPDTIYIPAQYEVYLELTGYLDYVLQNVDQINFKEKVANEGRAFGGVAYIGRMYKVIDVQIMGLEYWTASVIVHEAAHHEQYSRSRISTEHHACYVQSNYMKAVLNITEEYLPDWQGLFNFCVEYGKLYDLGYQDNYGSFGMKLVDEEEIPVEGAQVTLDLNGEQRVVFTNSLGYANFYMLPKLEDYIYFVQISIDGITEDYYIKGNSSEISYYLFILGKGN